MAVDTAGEADAMPPDPSSALEITEAEIRVAVMARVLRRVFMDVLPRVELVGGLVPLS